MVWAFTSLDAFRRPLRLRYLCGAFRAARMVPPKHTLKVIFQVDSRLRLLGSHKAFSFTSSEAFFVASEVHKEASIRREEA